MLRSYNLIVEALCRRALVRNVWNTLCSWMMMSGLDKKENPQQSTRLKLIFMGWCQHYPEIFLYAQCKLKTICSKYFSRVIHEQICINNYMAPPLHSAWGECELCVGPNSHHPPSLDLSGPAPHVKWTQPESGHTSFLASPLPSTLCSLLELE